MSCESMPGMGAMEHKDMVWAREDAQAQGAEFLSKAGEQAETVKVLEEVRLNSRQRYRRARKEAYLRRKCGKRDYQWMLPG